MIEMLGILCSYLFIISAIVTLIDYNRSIRGRQLYITETFIKKIPTGCHSDETAYSFLPLLITGIYAGQVKYPSLGKCFMRFELNLISLMILSSRQSNLVCNMN